MEKEYSCFFTGHRKLPKKKTEQIKKLLEAKIKSLIENKGVTSFIAGGALGFDTLAAKEVLKLKEEYPYIELILYLPCYNQSMLWSDSDKFEWHMIMSKADEYKYITEGNYTDGCMQKRNYEMVKDALYGICYCVISKSGTGMTVSYAKQLGNILDNIADEVYG